MKNIITEILKTLVNHERKQANSDQPELFLNQKKQLWYGMMNHVDEEKDTPHSTRDN